MSIVLCIGQPPAFHHNLEDQTTLMNSWVAKPKINVDCRAGAWTKYHIAVTQYHDDEPTSTKARSLST